MATSPIGKPVVGNRNDNPEQWIPAQWDEPTRGRQVAGELTILRDNSTTGTHRAGLWRTGVGVAGCASDGTSRFTTSAPDGDETYVVLDGEATVTVTATGEKYTIGAGSIVGHPKGLEITVEITSTTFKKFWATWNSPQVATPEQHLYVRHIDDDDPAAWEKYEWDDDNGQHWSCGENLVMRSTGSTGSLKFGLWRSGPNEGDSFTTPEPTVACVGNRCAGHTISASRGVGDESMLLLNGTAHIVNHDSGEEVDVAAGDIIMQWMGPNITWTSQSPYMRKVFIMTNAEL